MTLRIQNHPGRLFPFGYSYNDSALDYADDRAVPVFVANGIPFWSRYYSTIFVSYILYPSVVIVITTWSPGVERPPRFEFEPTPTPIVVKVIVYALELPFAYSLTTSIWGLTHHTL